MTQADLYPLHPFRVHRIDTLLEIVARYPLAALFTGAAGRGLSSLVPLYAVPNGDEVRLLGHVDRNNPQADHLRVGAGVQFVFQGPDRYASPDLYPEPQLPGWLYVSVQGAGEVVAEPGPDEARTMLIEATRRFGGPGQEFALRGEDPRVDRFLPGIAAFEIRVGTMSGIAKLAQDKGGPSAALAARFLASSPPDPAPLFERLLRETLPDGAAE